MSAVAHQGGYPALGRICRGEAALDGVGAIVYHDVVPDHAQLLAVRLHGGGGGGGGGGSGKLAN